MFAKQVISRLQLVHVSFDASNKSSFSSWHHTLSLSSSLHFRHSTWIPMTLALSSGKVLPRRRIARQALPTLVPAMTIGSYVLDNSDLSLSLSPS